MPHITHYFKTLVGFFIDILIYFIPIKKLKEFLHLVPWLHFVVRGNQLFSSAKLYASERGVGSLKCRGRRCQVYLNVIETETLTGTSTKQTKSIMSLIAMKVPLLTYWRVRSVASSMLDKQLISSAVDGLITKVMTESI